MEEYHPGGLEIKSEDTRGAQKIGGRPPSTGRGPLSCGPLEHPPTDFFRLYNPTYPKTIKYQDRSGVPLPQASVATKNLSGAHSGTLPEGDPITSIYVFDLSLSLVFLYGMILMYPELCYYS